jgi:carbonic anhydrase
MFPLVPDPTAPPPVAVASPAPSSPSVAAERSTAGPDEALAALVAGNRRFVSGQTLFGHDVRRAVAVATDPAPYAVLVGCMDSRVPLEAVFDQDFGRVFAVRSAGHVLDRVAVGSIEIAVGAVGVPLVLVLGHRRCAAVATAVAAWRDGRRPAGSMGTVVDDIADSIRETAPDRVAAVDPVARRHTVRTVARLHNVLGGATRVVGAYYDTDTGVVELM